MQLESCRFANYEQGKRARLCEPLYVTTPGQPIQVNLSRHAPTRGFVNMVIQHYTDVGSLPPANGTGIYWPPARPVCIDSQTCR
jgi:hypothetical protein